MILCTSTSEFLYWSDSVNRSKWCLMDPVRGKWCISIDLLACAISACFFKGNKVVLFKWLSIVHMVVCEVAIVLQSKSIKLFKDAATGPNLSLTTDHMCLLCSLDFGGIKLSGCRNCFWLYLLLPSTLCPCRFLFHMQDMIFMRSHYRMFSFAIASVYGVIWSCFVLRAAPLVSWSHLQYIYISFPASCQHDI